VSVLISGKSLRERFEDFISTLDGYENIDDLMKERDPSGKQRADYLLADRSIIVEQKTLETDPAQKPQRYVENLVERGKLIFWGTLSTDAIFRQMPDGQRYKYEMFQKLTKVLADVVAKADKQTRETREIFDIPDALGVLVILNENARTLIPDTIRFGLEVAFSKKHADGQLRYVNNTGVIVISELHTVNESAGTRLVPLMNFTHSAATDVDQFMAFRDTLFTRWAAFNQAPLIPTTQEEIFKAR
jgi:hypothetical protein